MDLGSGTRTASAAVCHSPNMIFIYSTSVIIKYMIFKIKKLNVVYKSLCRNKVINFMTV